MDYYQEGFDGWLAGEGMATVITRLDLHHPRHVEKQRLVLRGWRDAEKMDRETRPQVAAHPPFTPSPPPPSPLQVR